MDIRKVFMLLAVGVLLSGLSGVALANEQGMSANDPLEYSPSADPSWPPAQTDASQIREPMETGAVPDLPDSSSNSICCGGDRGDPTYWPGGP